MQHSGVLKKVPVRVTASVGLARTAVPPEKKYRREDRDTTSWAQGILGDIRCATYFLERYDKFITHGQIDHNKLNKVIQSWLNIRRVSNALRRRDLTSSAIDALKIPNLHHKIIARIKTAYKENKKFNN